MPAAAHEKSFDDLLSPTTTFLRPHQRKGWEREIRHTDELLARNATSEKKFLQNSVRIRQQNEARKRLLAEQTPRRLTGVETDRAVALRRVLLDRVQDGAPTRQEQYAKPNQVPVDLKDRIRAWHARSKADVLRLKKLDLLLHPDSEDRNLCHTDKYLPNEQPREAYRSDRYGMFSLSPAAKANYDDIDWTSPEVQARLAEDIAAGRIRVNYDAKPSEVGPHVVGDVEVREGAEATEVTIHRDPPRGMESATCSCGRVFTGRAAKAQVGAHEKRHRSAAAERIQAG